MAATPQSARVLLRVASRITLREQVACRPCDAILDKLATTRPSKLTHLANRVLAHARGGANGCKGDHRVGVSLVVCEDRGLTDRCDHLDLVLGEIEGVVV